MKVISPLVIAAGLFLTYGPASAIDRLVEGFPDLPKDARDVAERGVACMHFWGEITGSNKERDKEVNRALKKLKCDRIEQDLAKVRTKHQKNPKVLAILREASFD